MTEMTVSDILTRYRELLTRENIDDARIDAAAQGSIARLGQGESAEQVYALLLLAGVRSESGGLAGIYGDDSPEAEEIASQMETEASQLIISDADAALVTPPDSPIPALVFRGETRDDPSRLDSALTGTIRESRSWLSDQVEVSAVGDPMRPWMCTWVCGLCAAALLDGVPFDEIPVCLACLTCISGSG